MSYQSSLWTRTLCASAIAFSLSSTALAADEFAVSTAQMQALGVQLQRLDKPASIPGMTYPARVVLPPSQEYVVSAPLAGVVDQLLIGQNEAVKPGQASSTATIRSALASRRCSQLSSTRSSLRSPMWRTTLSIVDRPG